MIFHFFSIKELKKLMPDKEDHNHFLRSALIFGLLLTVHTLEVLLFQLTIFLGSNFFSLGRFTAKFTENFSDYFYYAISTYSTLGLTEFYPTEGLKVLSGFGSLIGFSMITWSATFFYSLTKDSSSSKS